MADVFTRKKRSEIMSRIRAKNTKLESLFLKRLSAVSHKAGYRYRKHYLGVSGKPDIAFPGKKLAVFIDGCFWHGCRLHSRTPLSNVEYWEKKLSRNKSRDKEVNKELRKAGWKVVRLWEHEAKRNPEHAVAKVMRALKTTQ